MTACWRGVFPAATTQFQAGELLDVGATVEHLGRLVEAGVHGLVLLGTLGENGSLEPAEKRQVLKAAVGHLGGRVPVLAGVAENTTRLACRFAEDAERIGVDGLMVLPAMLYKADRREVQAHFRAVARATRLPVMVYNNPVSYHVDISPEMLAELADEPSLVAVKESSDNVRRITDIRNACGDRYALFTGVDDLALESLLMGADGWVAGLVNAFPEESLRLWDLASEGRWDEALVLYRWFSPMLHLDTHVKLVQYIKLAAQERGFGTETTRAPRLRIEGHEREKVLETIRTGLRDRPLKAAPIP